MSSADPATEAPDDLLEKQSSIRVRELVPIRYGRMLVSRFTFYRGAAYPCHAVGGWPQMPWQACRFGRCLLPRASPTPPWQAYRCSTGSIRRSPPCSPIRSSAVRGIWPRGPSAAVCAVCAAVITPLVGAAALGTDKAATYAAALAFAAAAVYLLLGSLRMGWVSTFLSKAVVGGFAIGIIIDQTHKLFGVDGPEGSYAEKLWRTLTEIDNTSGATLAVGAGSLAVLLLMRRWLPKWPRALIVVAAAIVLVELLGLDKHGVEVTGHVPTGLFAIGLPGIGWSDARDLLAGALAVVFVGYSESLAADRAMALKHGYEIDPNQELIAQSGSCAVTGLVGGLPVDGSLSKTSVGESAGQVTQMASLINAGFILLTLLFLAGVFEQLPAATLGAVVIDAMVGLVTFDEMKRYYRVNKPASSCSGSSRASSLASCSRSSC